MQSREWTADDISKIIIIQRYIRSRNRVQQHQNFFEGDLSLQFIAKLERQGLLEKYKANSLKENTPILEKISLLELNIPDEYKYRHLNDRINYKYTDLFYFSIKIMANAAQQFEIVNELHHYTFLRNAASIIKEGYFYGTDIVLSNKIAKTNLSGAKDKKLDNFTICFAPNLVDFNAFCSDKGILKPDACRITIDIREFKDSLPKEGFCQSFKLSDFGCRVYKKNFTITDKLTVTVSTELGLYSIKFDFNNKQKKVNFRGPETIFYGDLFNINLFCLRLLFTAIQKIKNNPFQNKLYEYLSILSEEELQHAILTFAKNVIPFSEYNFNSGYLSINSLKISEILVLGDPKIKYDFRGLTDQEYKKALSHLGRAKFNSLHKNRVRDSETILQPSIGELIVFGQTFPFGPETHFIELSVRNNYLRNMTNEILLVIISKLDPKDLLSFVLVNHYFAEVIRPYLKTLKSSFSGREVLNTLDSKRKALKLSVKWEDYRSSKNFLYAANIKKLIQEFKNPDDESQILIRKHKEQDHYILISTGLYRSEKLKDLLKRKFSLNLLGTDFDIPDDREIYNYLLLDPELFTESKIQRPEHLIKKDGFRESLGHNIANILGKNTSNIPFIEISQNHNTILRFSEPIYAREFAYALQSHGFIFNEVQKSNSNFIDLNDHCEKNIKISGNKQIKFNGQASITFTGYKNSLLLFLFIARLGKFGISGVIRKDKNQNILLPLNEQEILEGLKAVFIAMINEKIAEINPQFSENKPAANLLNFFVTNIKTNAPVKEISEKLEGLSGAINNANNPDDFRKGLNDLNLQDNKIIRGLFREINELIAAVYPKKLLHNTMKKNS